jgi:hypothetical protein
VHKSAAGGRNAPQGKVDFASAHAPYEYLITDAYDGDIGDIGVGD